MAQTALNPSQQTQTVHPTITGLSEQEVQAREQRGETNDYQARVSRSYWDIFRDNVLNLFNMVLFPLLGVVVALGDYATAIFAGFSVVSNTFLGMIQEMQAKRRLDKLAALSEQEVQVLRGGVVQKIPMRRVVVDDVIFLQPGDRAVVDGQVIESDALEMDESLLTGESDAVFKEGGNEILSGSFAIAGVGLIRATRVGKESNISKLSEIAKQYKNTKTPTQIRIDIFVEITVFVMLLFVPLLFLHDLFVVEPSLPFLQAVRNAVVFVTSLVPQGLVLVAILSLTVGAIRISLRDTLVQKVNAVESLANATVLCFDKTGTLTKNQLAVQKLIPLTQELNTSDLLEELSRYLYNLSHLNRTAQAIHHFVAERIDEPASKTKLQEISFSSGRKWGAVQFADKTLILGAPERLLEQAGTPAMQQQALELSQQGLRVLALAQVIDPLEDTALRDDVQPIALIVLSDQVRDDIHETLQAFRDEQIELKVISGDNIETVRAIAKQSGMPVTGAYTGAEVSAMSESELEHAVQEANVFARVEPNEKQRIISALQNLHHYVAMVGDGVNDVPALKQANLAIVMNDGTQISKDVADIVLLNNAMSTLPFAFKEGKEITQTIYGTTKLFMARNFYAVMFFILVGFLALPFPITPVQISWATFFSLNIPATLIAFTILRPKFIHNFRDDVLDFILTAGFTGTIFSTLLYVLVYFLSDGDVVTVRSAIAIYQMFFNSYLVMVIQGVDFYKPQTFLTHWRVVLTMTALSLFGILVMYALPGLFEFQSFGLGNSFWVYVLLFAILSLSMIFVSHGLTYRYLLKRFYALLQRDERRVQRATKGR